MCFCRRMATSRQSASFSCFMVEKRESSASCRPRIVFTSFNIRLTASIFTLLFSSCGFGWAILRLICSNRYGWPCWKHGCENSISSRSNRKPPLSIDVILWKPSAGKKVVEVNKWFEKGLKTDLFLDLSFLFKSFEAFATNYLYCFICLVWYNIYSVTPLYSDWNNSYKKHTEST